MASTVLTNGTTKTVLVVAPATLAEDFTFDITLGGKHAHRPFTVTVPKGGVEEGQEFEIPYPASDSESSSNTSEAYDDIEMGDDDKKTLPCQSGSSDSHAPYGKWRTHLFSCCDVMTQSTFWIAFLCPTILIAQLATRMGLTFRGVADMDHVSISERTAFRDAEEEAGQAYNKIILSFVAVLFLANFVPVFGLAIVATYVFLLMIFVGSNIRRSMRQRYRIEPRLKGCVGKAKQSVDSSMEDYMCMAFCGCCSLVQMARHTHHDKEYPGYCCTTTGLEVEAPRIV